MNIWAFDLGTHCGWAISLDGKIKSGTWDFSNGHFDGAGMCYVKFGKELSQLGGNLVPNIIFYEAVMSHGADGVYAQHKYGGFMAKLQAVGESLSIPYHGVPVGTIKKFWTGSGNAKKDSMVHAARKRGFNPKTEDEADALAVLHYGIHYMKGQSVE